MSLRLLIIVCAMTCAGCEEKNKGILLGKIKRETVAFSPKVTGRILRIYVQEGNEVHPGDTLARLDVPEVSARIAQARGAVKASSAQHLLANNGYTFNQLRQLRAKYAAAADQLRFAERSFQRANALFADSLLSPQSHDEAYNKYQSAKAQLDAVTAELNEAERGTRYETKIATAGQQEQASGALQEAEVNYSERYIIATNHMAVETITLHEGELAPAGYPVFNGYIPNSTWFRFTVPESRIAPFKKGETLNVQVLYNHQVFPGRLLTIKQLPRYADITTAYPDYTIDDAIYELKIAPVDQQRSTELLYNATIRLDSLSKKR